MDAVKLEERAERRERNRANAKAMRERDKARKERKAKEAQNLTLHDFWTANRKIGKESDLNEMRERQDYVLALCDDMQSAMVGDHGEDSELYTESVEEEVNADVAQFGTTSVEVGLLEFQRNPSLFAQLMAKANEPTKVFLRLGIITAVDDFTLHKFQSWLAEKKAPTPQTTSNYVTLHCACGTITGSEPVPLSIAADYERLSIKWLCIRCRQMEANARSQSTLAQIRKPADGIYDGWGRLAT